MLAGRSESSPGGCLSKTQVPAQLVRGCIGAEAWPVLER